MSLATAMTLLPTMLIISSVFSSAMREDRHRALTKAAGVTALVALVLLALSLTVAGPDESILNLGAVAVALVPLGPPPGSACRGGRTLTHMLLRDII